jgi:hypothetical protein
MIEDDFKAFVKWGGLVAAVILLIIVMSITLIPGCNRTATSFWAGATGADWIVVQYSYDGSPINCWKLNGVSVSNETQSDGVYWKDENGHLIHIAGWYNRVQVSGGRFEEAAELLGVDAKKITNGKYLQ